MAEDEVKDEGRTLLVQLTNGEEWLVDVPVGARVSFGPAIPPRTARGYDAPVQEYALRVYAKGGREDLIAAFPGVRMFRWTKVQVDTQRPEQMAPARRAAVGIAREMLAPQMVGLGLPETRVEARPLETRVIAGMPDWQGVTATMDDPPRDDD